MPNSFTYLHQTPIFGSYVVWFDSKNGYHKHVFKKNSECSKYNNHSKLNSQHIWRTLIYSFIEHKNLHFDSVEDIHDIHMSSKKYEDCGYG